MEYQAKELFAKHGVTTTLGVVAETPEAARAAAEEMGGVTVIKAQVKAGGRGKAGGVKLAKSPEEAQEHAGNILGMEIKGLTVNRVLVTPATPPVEEYYFSFLLDRSNRSHLCIASVEGGVEIEEVAKTNPDAVKKIPVDALEGVTPEKAAAIVDEAKFPAELRDQAIEMVQALWKVYVEEDATLVEVNPLARLEGDKLEALDGKVSLDENASEVRHPEHAEFEIREEADPLESKAKDKGLNYVKLAKTPQEAQEHAGNILGMEIKGLTVNRVLVTPATPPVEEYYFSFLLDRSNRSHLCIASVEGGV